MKAIAKLLGLVALAAAIPVAQIACGGNDSNLPPPPPPPGTVASASATATTTETATTPPPPAPPPPALVLGAESETPNPLPTVKITAPTSDQVVATDKAADFAREARREELADRDGQPARPPHPRQPARTSPSTTRRSR